MHDQEPKEPIIITNQAPGNPLSLWRLIRQAHKEQQRLTPKSRIAIIIIFPLFILLGAALLGVGGYLLQGKLAFKAHASSAQGTVVNLKLSHHEHSHSSAANTLTYPVIEFRTPDGKTVSFTDQTASAWGPKLGAEVRVLYDPTRPDKAVIDDTFSLYFAPGLVLILGAGLVICFLPYLIKCLRGTV